MKFNSKPIKSASLIQSSLIQTISESEASSISGGGSLLLQGVAVQQLTP